VIQMCGGLGVQMRGRSVFPSMTFLESFRGWQSTWFYYNDVSSPGMSTGLPPYMSARMNAPRSLVVDEEEKAEVAVLVSL
jgi:hypothetical protein